LVFPTPDDIRNSVEGYSGGGTVPSSKNNVYKPFLKPLWHRWTSPLSVSSPTTWPLLKPNNVPHIKTYYQLMGGGGDDRDESSMQWFCLTSHNLSKAAWGEVRKNDRGQHLYVPSWELGVFVAPSMFETKEEKAAGHKVKMVSIAAAAATAAASGINTRATNCTSTRVVGIPLPYAINPTKYETTERPFSWEETYPLPDRFGRRGVRG
jgi:tyrosyl-DNA phosphodiesterase 1